MIECLLLKALEEFERIVSRRGSVHVQEESPRQQPYTIYDGQCHDETTRSDALEHSTTLSENADDLAADLQEARAYIALLQYELRAITHAANRLHAQRIPPPPPPPPALATDEEIRKEPTLNEAILNVAKVSLRNRPLFDGG